MEDSIKRPMSEPPKNLHESSKNVKSELDDIFAKIGKVTGIVSKIEEEKKVE
jgi:hypothetical protein